MRIEGKLCANDNLTWHFLASPPQSTPTSIPLLSQDTAGRKSSGQLAVNEVFGFWGSPDQEGWCQALPTMEQPQWKTERWQISGQAQTFADAQN